MPSADFQYLKESGHRKEASWLNSCRHDASLSVYRGVDSETRTSKPAPRFTEDPETKSSCSGARSSNTSVEAKEGHHVSDGARVVAQLFRRTRCRASIVTSWPRNILMRLPLRDFIDSSMPRPRSFINGPETRERIVGSLYLVEFSLN